MGCLHGPSQLSTSPRKYTPLSRHSQPLLAPLSITPPKYVFRRTGLFRSDALLKPPPMSETKRFRAGVLFGEEVRELLDYAKATGFAMPAVNCISTHTVNATLAAAREVNSPVIVQFSNGGAQFFIGKTVKGDNQLGPVLGGIAGAQYVAAAAKAYGVPVIVHTDHCAKKLLPWVDGLLA